jgi:hypothetical protein
MFRCHEQVGGQGQLEPAARRDPIDRGDDRLAAPVQLGQSREPPGSVISVDRLASCGRLEIPARTEKPVARSRYDPDPQVRSGLQPGERLVQRMAGGDVHGIRARPVKDDREHAPGCLRPDRAVGLPPAALAVALHVRHPARATLPGR